MAKAVKRTSGLKRAAPKKRARKAAAGSRGLNPSECFVDDPEFEKEMQTLLSKLQSTPVNN